MSTKLIRFDWAIKKILRDKANFGILEGFLTTLIGEKMSVEEILESSSNQETEDDKFNQVDILVKNARGEFIIVEVQNSKQYDYFQRMLYGTSKLIAENIKLGEKYMQVKKVYSITIAYFDLGQGEDYAYHGKTEFVGIHEQDKLLLAEKQTALFNKNQVYELYPEYWIIKASKFNDKVSDKLDEWIYFLKNSEIRDDFTALGLAEAKEKLTEIQMSEEERRRYHFFQKRLSDLASYRFAQEVDYRDELDEREQKGREEGILQVVQNMIASGFDNATIASATQLSHQQIDEIRNKISN